MSQTAVIEDITDAQFVEDVLMSDTPVLVEIWAEWCPPCRQLAPILDKIAAERAGSLRVVKLNQDENPATSADYRVMAVPTMLLFRDGKPVLQMVGARPKSHLDREIDKALA
ncbi:thioredoxin [Nocardioides sp. NPDC101246]|uniref:thioredoxin n=1 Tax=Nocardioides sp. NPDC101246 TaxID=3364336 RepID=UPI003807C22C